MTETCVICGNPRGASIKQLTAPFCTACLDELAEIVRERREMRESIPSVEVADRAEVRGLDLEDLLPP
jgi:hypothetical protein